MSNLNLPAPTAFVFSGGAARSAAQVGMLRAAIAAGLEPALFIGSSTGALNAGAAAADLTTAAVLLEATWLGLGEDPKLTTLWRSAARGIANSQAKRTAAILRTHVSVAIPDIPITDVKASLTLVATNLASGLATQCTSGSLLDSVMACMALPVVLPPVASGQSYLIDGGVAANVPVTQALSKGARSIVLFDTGASAVPDAEVDHIGWYEVMALAYSHMVRGQAAHDLARVAQEVPVLAISYADGNPFDFATLDAHIAGGEATARTLLSQRRTLVRPGIYGPLIGLERDDRLVDLYR